MGSREPFADQSGICSDQSPTAPGARPDELVNVDLKRSLPMHRRARDQT
ncbi:hypothetical protein [Streptomyces sp. NPDC056983]